MIIGPTPFKAILAAGLFFAAGGYGHGASADTLSGALAAGTGAIDVHSIACPAGSYLLTTQVSNESASTPLMSSQTNKGKKASNTTDPTPADGDYSPAAYVAGGSGTYYVTVNNSGAGPANYTLQYSCLTLRDALSAGLVSFTPTDIKDEAYEGVTAYNALQIGQSCKTGITNVDGTEKTLPVIAQSVVFPTDNSNSISYRSDTGNSILLSGIISDTGGLAGLASAVQDKAIFMAQDVKLDGNGNSIGYYGIKGKLQMNLTGRMPFLFTAPTFNPASCAKRLLVKIAVADICKAGQTAIAGQVNLWIPNNTTKFTDINAIPGSDGTARSGLPATLTINRTTAYADGADGNCASDPNARYDVTVWPTNAHVDANLPIPKYWLQ